MAGPESKIETAVSKYAETSGLLQRKFKTPGRRNAPDRLFLGPDRLVFFIEFKAEGEIARKGQVREANKLRALGFDVHFIDNIAKGKKTIDSYS